MDPITHITTGVLGAKVVRFEDRFKMLFCIIAAWLPDIDNIVWFFGPEYYLIHHRGFTHSFLGGFILSILLVTVFRVFITTFPIIRGALISYLLMFVHIYLDLVTSYGTQIFYPFTDTKYSLGSVFIIDPFYTFAIIIFIVISLSKKRNKQRILILGLIWIFVYPILNLGFRKSLEYRIIEDLKNNNIIFEKIHLSPELFAPVFWKVIVENDKKYNIGGMNLISGSTDFTSFSKAETDLLENFGNQYAIFNTYSWFAAYPIMKTERTGKYFIITFGDLRFFSTLHFVRDLLKNGKIPFSLTAVLDDNHNLVGYYQKPGGSRIIQHLE